MNNFSGLRRKSAIQCRHYPAASLQLALLGFALQCLYYPPFTNSAKSFLTSQGESRTVCYGIQMRLLHSELRKPDLIWERDEDHHHLFRKFGYLFLLMQSKKGGWCLYSKHVPWQKRVHASALLPGVNGH